MDKDEKKSEEFSGKRTASKFIVQGTDERAFLVVTGEAATKRDVIKECEKIRIGGGDFSTVAWTARMLANRY